MIILWRQSALLSAAVLVHHSSSHVSAQHLWYIVYLEVIHLQILTEENVAKQTQTAAFSVVTLPCDDDQSPVTLCSLSIMLKAVCCDGNFLVIHDCP
jgi:hypothetical protein